MEDKLKRESKDFVQKLFKKQDKNNAAAIHKSDMKKILQSVLPEYFLDYDAELEQLLLQHVKVTKYTEHNKKTNQFDVKYQEDTLDFPSVLAVVVHFLKKDEKKSSNAFSGVSVVKYTDFPTTERSMINTTAESKKRLF
ncbi:uncharacterized protein LOC110856159 [Folsomia candida]|uniref:EF-hand domain-containing protein n=1 Tax=Folsomia candida TaxID=158441 RepID=A0A226DMY3_FOLCA|nr:uncharacterized protein LOC110856159 [Folsomia candida]OXA46470.1 hypothetical protein Fcan01_18748 [Folsomia candida]